MTLSIKDLFGLNSKFKDIRIIAGNKKTNRNIKDVMVMEAPDGAYWVKEGDLLISAGFGFKDDTEQLCETIKILAERKAAGLAVKKGRFIKEIPASVIELAEQLDFPLLELPIEMSYRDLTWPIMGRIINEENYYLRICEQLRKTLWQTHNERYSSDDILNLMKSYIDKTLILFNSRLDISIYKGQDGGQEALMPPVESIIKYIENITIKNGVLSYPLSFQIEGHNSTVFALKTPDEILGYLCIVSSSEIYEFEKIMLSQCIPFLTITILAHQKQQESSLKLREDFFSGLLLGNYLSRSAIEKGVKFFNLQIDINRAVVIINHLALQCNSSHPKLMEDILYELQSMDELKDQNEIVKKDNSIIMLYKVQKEKNFHSFKKDLITWSQHLHETLRFRYPKIPVNIGVGNIYAGLNSLHKSYQEASLSLKLGPKIFNSTPGVFFYNDLKLYHILFLFRNHTAMIDLYQDTVGKLTNHDNKHDTDLVESLKAFFDNNCNINQTANKLYIHRNTLYNRLHRVSEITGASPFTSEGQLLLQLALKLKEIYDLGEF